MDRYREIEFKYNKWRTEINRLKNKMKNPSVLQGGIKVDEV